MAGWAIVFKFNLFLEICFFHNSFSFHPCLFLSCSATRFQEAVGLLKLKFCLKTILLCFFFFNLFLTYFQSRFSINPRSYFLQILCCGKLLQPSFRSNYPNFNKQDNRDNNWEYPSEFCIIRQQVIEFSRRFPGTEINPTDCFANLNA